jgi:hypothetical protein
MDGSCRCLIYGSLLPPNLSGNTENAWEPKQGWLVFETRCEHVAEYEAQEPRGHDVR